MEKELQSPRSHERWAHFRFSVIGALLAAPPPRGELQRQLQELALKKWRHPISGEWICFGLSTIERWYYKAARSKEGPVDVLKRKIRSDQGHHGRTVVEKNGPGELAFLKTLAQAVAEFLGAFGQIP